MAKQVKVVTPAIVAPVVVALATSQATDLGDTVRVACNPQGIGRVVPGRCVAAALAAIGAGCTVAEYRERMAKWVASHPQPHMAYPGGGTADGVLRYLVDRNRKVVVVPGMQPATKGKATKPATKGKATKPATKGKVEKPATVAATK